MTAVNSVAGAGDEHGAQSGAPTVAFPRVRATEHAAINLRREAQGRPPIETVGNENASEAAIYDTVGLALSGGGIRSAAFCLGALQALHVSGLIKYVDYLSTVSGGGYIGASMTAAMSGPADDREPAFHQNEDRFPFQSRLNNEDTPAVRHIRDYSNYLMPKGIADIVGGIVIYLRGLVANSVIVMGWLLLFVIASLLLKPILSAVIGAIDWFELGYFVVTLYLFIGFALYMLVWSVLQSVSLYKRPVDAESWITRGAVRFGAIILIFALIELQPFALHLLFEIERTGAVIWVIGGLLGLLVVVSILSNVIDRVLKTTTDSDRLYRRALAGLGQTVVKATGVVLPLLLWIAYLQLTFWGISKISDVPSWLAAISKCVVGWRVFSIPDDRTVLAFYMVMFGVLFFIACFDRLNANTLHRLYRERLSRAFLFDFVSAPEQPSGKEEIFVEKVAGVEKRLALRSLDRLRLSELDETVAPYHLINTALNIQGSRHVNQRARNAEFFLLSKHYCGSEPTGYIETRALEAKSPRLDLATAIAVSSAAASANMGANTIRLLTPTLTLLNVRLGLWLDNPRDNRSALTRWQQARRLFVWLTNAYFFREMLGQLNERSSIVYLTDGGHVENLGLYELLKRRCRIIMVVDAEADPEMNFASLIKLQRHASIDLGVRIELPWRSIRETTLAVSKEIAGNDGQGAVKARLGPHCAVGRIMYDDAHWGVLVYFKSSISGDENDYILDYKRRNMGFPHETTNDQFFTEEQFEVYRSLGFHAVNRVLAGEEAVPTHSGRSDVYEPIIKIWKGARFNDPAVNKAEEIFRFAAEDGGEVLPLTEKVLPIPYKPPAPKAKPRAPRDKADAP